MTKKSAAKKVSAKATKAGIAGARLQTEQTMRNISRLLDEETFESVGEMNAFLATLDGGKLQTIAPEHDLSAREEAQELAWEAMEAKSGAQARKLMKRALAKDPDCVDALVALAGLDATSPKQAIEGLQRAVAAGERSLGAKFFKENKGEFWGWVETRPYMRARQQLAEMYREAGLDQDAIAQYAAMLELNPNDNQGVREPLLGLYLETGDFAGARRLLKQYKDECSAAFAWFRVLERILAGDKAGAATSLKAAREANPFVELYMTAQLEPPKDMPGSYSMGSVEEALCCLESLIPAWMAHPMALFWLMEAILREQTEPKPARSAGSRKKTLLQ